MTMKMHVSTSFQLLADRIAVGEELSNLHLVAIDRIPESSPCDAKPKDSSVSKWLVVCGYKTVTLLDLVGDVAGSVGHV